MKKKDLIVIAIVLLVALGVGIPFMMPTKSKAADKYISIQVNGKETQHINWDKNSFGKKIKIEGVGGTNYVKITEEGVSMIEADCPDQICINMAPIKDTGEMIVCLPHRVIVEIKSETADDDLDVMLR
ncbi:NusG domain II-containing protein [Peptoniphilus sp. KCTC 25270]|uniref:NusG domain II-containing protein n=1 Tax=Peptoniphilus sp. KCTC 25270 TaxID=2897414 RepID=UPI001E545A43|nr:NusG domain II-containing protein [Peptoniphilus sp. KCTC 25270]MCD1146906.1 NusG domain II-containing protein [Peptoniphilus sp. KCTC 25270]